MGLLLGIDIGSTSVKSVLFNETGEEIACSKRVVPSVKKAGGINERNLGEIWEKTVETIKESVASSNLSGKIISIGISGAGDGLIVLDGRGQPVRDSITSLDTRAADIVNYWIESGTAEKAFPIIGESPFPGTPVALLKWLKENEPESYTRAKHILFLKDWIKYKLTGQLSTDATDASATLTDLNGNYHEDIFNIFGIEECFAKTIPILPSEEISGYVTLEAAGLTGLKLGTPVTTGVHDCSAASLGCGCLRSGETCLITGSWSGNQVISDLPITDQRQKKFWVVRNYVIPGFWLLLSASPASGVNLEWFVKQFGDAISKDQKNVPLYKICDRLVEQSDFKEFLIYHPFLFGSKLDAHACAGFYGIRPWHNIGDFLRAIYEGIVFNHCIHLEELRRIIKIQNIKICGGGANSDIWMQIFANAINKSVAIQKSSEVSALGAAIVAAKGVGLYKEYEVACKEMTSSYRYYEPIAEQAKILTEKFSIYKNLYLQMMLIWESIETQVRNVCQK